MENRRTIWAWAGIAFELGYLIAIPIVVLVFAGRWLDRAYGTGAIFLIAGVLLALASTTILIARRVKDMAKKLE